MRRRRVINRTAIGVAMVVVGLVALAISYNADESLPLRPTYHLTAEVPDAAQLRRGDPVRIGGARVGIVRSVEAVRASRDYARIGLAIYGGRLVPDDTTVSIRPLSILGAKALQLDPGPSQRMLPDGAKLDLSHARATVDLPDTLSMFDAPTRQALRGAVGGLGTGLAGQGVSLNRTIRGTAALLAPLTRVADTFADPRTGLGHLIVASDRFMTALEPVSAELPDLLADGATTFGALADGPLGDLVDRLPDTEAGTTAALTGAQPVLADAAALARDLRPAGALLPEAAGRLHATLQDAIPVTGPLRTVAPQVGRLAVALRTFVRAPSLANSLTGLDLTVRRVKDLTDVVLPAQANCNGVAVALRNGASVIGEGDKDGSWFTFIPVFSPFLFPQAADNDDTHRNPHPIQDARGCAAGNTPYEAGKHVGNPSKLSLAHENTVPPAQARQRAADAGLFAPAQGARLR